MNAIEAPIPLEEEFPALAEGLSQVANGTHPTVQTVLAEKRAVRIRNKIGQWHMKMLKQPGRNEPCHCGSGKKFKKCCGQ
jgi:uncharacterized protein YecA (UPF0149 family)